MNKANSLTGNSGIASVLVMAAALLALPAPLRATDKAYVVEESRPAGRGVELVLRDLGEEGRRMKLVVYEQDRLVDLAEAREAPGTAVRRGDILFLGKGKQMFITPGRTVHAKLAAGQPGEAEAIDGLSLRLAAAARDADASSPAAGSELDRVRRSFLFVLEFALGAPFTAGQERLILEAFDSRWWAAKSAGEKKSFLQYPQVVAWVLKAGQKELEEMRQDLEETTRQWLRESPASDPVVAMIRQRLAERGRTVVAGDPPLTEMAASAFSELYAFSRLLRRDGAAAPGQLSASDVAGVRAELLAAWQRFSAAERGQVAATPGLWLVLRTLAVHGDAAQRDAARRRLLSLTAGEAEPGRAGEGSAAGDPLNEMIKHNVLMNIQQQTFNTYMWSRGFRYQPATGKMW